MISRRSDWGRLRVSRHEAKKVFMKIWWTETVRAILIPLIPFRYVYGVFKKTEFQILKRSSYDQKKFYTSPYKARMI